MAALKSLSISVTRTDLKPARADPINATIPPALRCAAENAGTFRLKRVLILSMLPSFLNVSSTSELARMAPCSIKGALVFTLCFTRFWSPLYCLSDHCKGRVSRLMVYSCFAPDALNQALVYLILKFYALYVPVTGHISLHFFQNCVLPSWAPTLVC